jgi:hypothetical protein
MQNLSKPRNIIILIILLSFVSFNCNKDSSTNPSLPVVNTSSVISVTATTSSAGGNVSSDGKASVTARGVCWSTSPNPLITGNHTTDGAGTGTFSSAITGLNPVSSYYVRAYATNSVGTAYGNEVSFTTTNPDVYTAGYELNASSYSVAKVWKNGVATSLSSGVFSAQGWARAVYVSGTDVYVVGYEFNGIRYTAKLWKNGTSTSLTNGNFDAQAWAIYVSGSDVYVGGYEANAAGKYVAKIWKNGIASSLSDGVNNAQVYGLILSQSDVYTVGYESVGGTSIAKFWKNGVATDLPGVNSTAYSVYVSGTDVYIAGTELAGGYAKVILWKNGVADYLTNGFSSIAIPYGVFVNGADVYVAGFDQHTGTGSSKAILWKNGVAIPLTDGTNYSRANSVYVYNNDVYASGYEIIYPISISRTWKNGVLVYSTDRSNNAASASVFVK